MSLSALQILRALALAVAATALVSQVTTYAAGGDNLNFYNCHSWSQVAIGRSDLRSSYRTLYAKAGYDSNTEYGYVAGFQTSSAGRVIQEHLDFAPNNALALAWIQRHEAWDENNLTLGPASAKSGGIGENSILLDLCEAGCAGSKIWFRRGAMDVAVSVQFNLPAYANSQNPGDPTAAVRALARTVNSRLASCGYPR